MCNKICQYKRPDGICSLDSNEKIPANARCMIDSKMEDDNKHPLTYTARDTRNMILYGRI